MLHYFPKSQYNALPVMFIMVDVATVVFFE